MVKGNGFDDIFDVLNVLKMEFSIEYNEKAIAGLDGVYFAVTINREEVTVGWDIWSGVFIVAKNDSRNTVVESVYRFLSEWEA